MEPLTQAELGRAKCATPGCDCGGALVLNPRCHQGKAVKAVYRQENGTLELHCGICDLLVCTVRVAPGIVRSVDDGEVVSNQL